MSTRYVFPELFYAAGSPIVVGGRDRLSLRWILHPSIGLPRALFHVWKFDGVPSLNRTSINRELLHPGTLLSWPDGPSAAVEVNISVPTGSVVLSGYSAARGAGHLVDQKTIVGPVSSLPVMLIGSPISSVTVAGNANSVSTDGRVLPISQFVSDPHWKLVERIGLPATSPSFDGTGYPLDLQGPVGSEVDPVSAAIQRVKGGSPDLGWPGTTDRGASPEPFGTPEPGLLVNEELKPLVEAVAELLSLVAEPSEQAEREVIITTTAPRSIHGIDSSPSWRARARPSTIKPLESMLLAAGVDPFAALGLGFGTTMDITSPQISIAPIVTPGIYMITVHHKVLLKKEIPSFPKPLILTLDGELAALYLGELPALPALPAGLVDTGSIMRPRLDPPGETDGPWLEVVELSWAVPVTPIAKMARPTGYTIARGPPDEPMKIRTEKRLSGGWTSFIPALSAKSVKPTSVRFTEEGVPEALPGDPPIFTYSVTTHDWFGRWSPWVSTDHARVSVGPQIPALHRIQLFVEDTQLPTRNVSAAIEFTWDWSYRSPGKIYLRILVHAEGTNPPDVPGSVLIVGGPTVSDLILDFSSASKDLPPPGVEAITDEARGNLRKYRIEATGIQIDFGTNSKIRVTARARAEERIAPARLGAWSLDVHAVVASPIPPPPPFVPSAMLWASLPDPRGLSRTTLAWTGTAPMYAVYLADETALLRELNKPSPDLEISAADRLPALRSIDIARARRAFRRIADRVPTNSLEITLPRGSRLIHFYGVVPISSTGVEGSLPASANSYFAVATPVVKTPEAPELIARDRGGEIVLTVNVPVIRVSADRIEIFRAPSRHRAVSIEDAGPPIRSVDASLAAVSADSVQWEVIDPTPGPAWQSVFYRAVAYGATDRVRGVYGGKSSPSAAIEVVPSSGLLPDLADLRVEDVATEPDYRLVSFVSDVTLARTLLGVHVFTVQIVALDATVTIRRVTADTLALVNGSLPTAAEQGNSIFRYDPVNPRVGRNYAWVRRDIRAVIVQVMDPRGRATSLTNEIP